MVVNLIKHDKMFSLTLPEKVKGQYWLSDVDEKGKPRDLISIEAINDVWTLKSNKNVSVLNSNNEAVASAQIQPKSFLTL